MAVVATYKTSNGATVRIHDDYLPKTEEENLRRKAIIQNNLNRIYTGCMERNWREWKETHPDGTLEEMLQELQLL